MSTITDGPRSRGMRPPRAHPGVGQEDIEALHRSGVVVEASAGLISCKWLEDGL